MEYFFCGFVQPFFRPVDIAALRKAQARISSGIVKHQRQIAFLAEQVKRPVHEITPLYQDILEEMQAHARITDYLPILVSKRVHEALRVRRTPI